MVEGAFDGIQRGFIFGRTKDDILNLYEIREEIPYDTIEVEGRNFRKRIRWSIETGTRGAEGFSPDGSQTTLLINNGYIELTKVNGLVDARIEFSPDNYPGWFLWREHRRCGVMERCDESRLIDCENAPPPFNPRPHNYVNIVLGRPEDNDKCLEHTLRKSDQSNRFRFRITFTGAAELESFHAIAHPTSKAERFACEPGPCRAIEYCDDDEMSYDIWESTELYE